MSRMPAPSIAVVGSVNRDLVVEVDRHPAPGETVLGRAHFWTSGGKGANQAVAAARLGSAVSFIGRVGDDDAGRQLRDELVEEGVDVTHLGTDEHAPSGLATIAVDNAGENAIVVSPGANSDLQPAHIEDARDVLAAAAVTLLQLETPIDTVLAAAGLAAGVVILNPAPSRTLGVDLLSEVDVLVPNRSELAAIVAAPLPLSADEAILLAAQIDVDAAVVTLGEEGAVVVEGDAAYPVRAPRVESIDSTGAGDAFCGALADALARGMLLAEAAQRAAHAGALATTAKGARAAFPDGSRLDAALTAAG